MRTLRTERLLLEPQVVAHAGEMFAVLSDPSIYAFENEAPASVEWLTRRYGRLESRRSDDGRELWLNWVVRRQPSPLIGYVQATVFPNRTALIAYVFNSAHWGRGFAREATEALLRELAESYGITTAGAIFKRVNHRSRRLLDRIGMSVAEGDTFPRPFAADDEEAMAKVLRASG
jgi:RimJ/RimL family protein N-acetyltransferase